MQYPYDAWYLLQKAEQSVFEEKKRGTSVKIVSIYPKKFQDFKHLN